MSYLYHSPDDGICPLCDGTAHVKISEKLLDAHIVWCERCGRFRIANGALIGFEQQRHLIAGLTRISSTPEQTVASRLTLTQDSVKELLTSSGLPRDLLDQLDITLKYAKEHQERPDQFIEYSKLAATDYPLVFAHDQGEFLNLLLILSEQQSLDEPLSRDVNRRTAFRITAKGWKELRELAKTGQDPNRAFVAMSFAGELLPVWKDGIKLALEDLGYMPIRIDQTDADNKIDDRIIAEIKRRHGVKPFVWTRR